MPSTKHLQQQARIFSLYIVRQQPQKQALDLYVRAMKTAEAHGRDARLLDFLGRHPKLVGFIDGGLALVNPQSEVRRRLYVMFAILEANPVFANKFLPQKRSKLYALRMVGVGIRAALRGVVGVVLVKFAGRT